MHDIWIQKCIVLIFKCIQSYKIKRPAKNFCYVVCALYHYYYNIIHSTLVSLYTMFQPCSLANKYAVAKKCMTKMILKKNTELS